MIFKTLASGEKYMSDESIEKVSHEEVYKNWFSKKWFYVISGFIVPLGLVTLVAQICLMFPTIGVAMTEYREQTTFEDGGIGIAASVVSIITVIVTIITIRNTTLFKLILTAALYLVHFGLYLALPILGLSETEWRIRSYTWDLYKCDCYDNERINVERKASGGWTCNYEYESSRVRCDYEDSIAAMAQWVKIFMWTMVGAGIAQCLLTTIPFILALIALWKTRHTDIDIVIKKLNPFIQFSSGEIDKLNPFIQFLSGAIEKIDFSRKKWMKLGRIVAWVHLGMSATICVTLLGDSNYGGFEPWVVMVFFGVGSYVVLNWATRPGKQIKQKLMLTASFHVVHAVTIFIVTCVYGSERNPGFLISYNIIQILNSILVFATSIINFVQLRAKERTNDEKIVAQTEGEFSTALMEAVTEDPINP